jgi:hypothetical protein
MRKYKFKLVHLIVVIAIAAAMLGIYIEIGARRKRFSEMFIQHAYSSGNHTYSITGYPEDIARIADSPVRPLSREAKLFHVELMLKYESLASSPSRPSRA